MRRRLARQNQGRDLGKERDESIGRGERMDPEASIGREKGKRRVRRREGSLTVQTQPTPVWMAFSITHMHDTESDLCLGWLGLVCETRREGIHERGKEQEES